MAIVALVATACGSNGDGDTAAPADEDLTAQPAGDEAGVDDQSSDAATDESDGPPQGTPATFAVASSTEQLIVTGAEPGETLTVFAADGTEIASDEVSGGKVDEFGQLVIRGLDPAAGYVVAAGSEATLATSPPTEVWSLDHVPDEALFDQEIAPGYGYLEMRDGTTLAVNVTLPGPVEEGPYPTVIEYSGYDPANPDAPQPSSLAAQALGFASVGVNVRGTGCSGGAFLVFEPPQSSDGYDVIETIARQPWVAHGMPGMVGISYPGIMQLFAAQTNPPSLAAIAPLSVIADTYRSTLRPGGILNTGFATSWAAERQAQAEPGGQAWAQKRMDEGDEVCIANQDMRAQNADMSALVTDHPYYDDLLSVAAPFEFVDQIDVPVFLAGAWQDEQTGGHFPDLLDRFDSAPLTRFTVTNGGHTDSLLPDIFQRWDEFLDLYVAREIPKIGDAAPLILGTLAASIFGVEVDIPEDRFADAASYEEALAAWEAEPSVRILFENGAGSDQPGAPIPSFEAGYDSWPVPTLEPMTWTLEPGGALAETPGASEAVESFAYDPSRSQKTTFEGGNPWAAVIDWDWQPPAAGAAVAYESEALDETLVMAGHGRVDLTLASTEADTDVQVVLTEVRPDGTEVYVQGGWLRASHRTLDGARTDELRAAKTHLEADAVDLVPGEPTELNIELFPFAHVFRPGSKIRIIVSAPGGVRPQWQFDVLDQGDVTNTVSVGGGVSSITLPVVPELASQAPAELPSCGALRGQPCREYAPIDNAG